MRLFSAPTVPQSDAASKTGYVQTAVQTGIIDIPGAALDQADQYGGGLPMGNYYTLGQVGQEEKEKQEIEATGDKPVESLKILGLPLVFVVGGVVLWLMMKK